MNRGSVKYLKLKAVKATVLIGVLQDSHGQILKHRQVDSDIARGVINADGVLTLEMGENNKTLTVLDKDLSPTLSCTLPEEPSNNVQFYSTIHCQPIGGA